MAGKDTGGSSMVLFFNAILAMMGQKHVRGASGQRVARSLRASTWGTPNVFVSSDFDCADVWDF